MRKDRMYYNYWCELKVYRTLTLKAPIDLHARVIKAIIKEKWLDIDHKKLASANGRRFKLAYEIKGVYIRFTLTSNVTAEDI